MRSSADLHDYQKKAIEFQCSHPASAVWLCPGLGKLQPNSEPVLTPNGWVPMGHLRAGDYVIGSDGRPTEILATFPQGEQEIVKVTFSDDSWCNVGWDHLWYVQNPRQYRDGLTGHVMTTRQIVDEGLTKKNGTRGYEPHWYIPMVEAVQFETKNFPIDPYSLGVVLGDGTITEQGYATVCTDRTIIEKYGFNFLRGHETCEYIGYGSLSGMSSVFRQLGLNGKRSWEKFVPSEYLFGDVEQRLALLQGLCDTDGSPIEGGGLEFSSTSERLIDDVVALTQSLGGVAKKSDSRITHYQNGEGRPSWRVNVKLPGHLTPFRLQRKLDKWIRPTKYQPIRKMVSVEVTGKEDSTCIKVAAANSLYVTRNYIVTHNTSITLSSITALTNAGILKSVIIVAPVRVCHLVWRQEAMKWSHTKHLTFNMLTGNKDQRTRNLLRPADVYLINYENIGWLSDTVRTYYTDKKIEPPFNGIVFDEITKLKNSATNRVKSLKKILTHFKWRTGLTGTPTSNGYKDLHGQYLVLDDGHRLGTSKTQFRTRFYKKQGPYKEVAYDDTEETIKNLIGDMTLEMSAADYNPLPDLIVNDVLVEMDKETRLKYDQLEKEFFCALDNGTEVEVFNQAALTNKALQFSNGAVYPIAGVPVWEPVHDLKLDALEEIIEESGGEPILCAYAYRSDAERIMTRFKDLRPININECKTQKSLDEAMRRWKTGDCQLMIGHPAGMGHGLDGLQERGHTVVWYGLNWSLDLYDQFNARIRRQGQGVPVICHRILCTDTLDQAQLLALEEKAHNQASLRKAVNEYRKMKEKSLKNV